MPRRRRAHRALCLCCARNPPAGDLLRAERERPGSEYGELINDYIKEVRAGGGGACADPVRRLIIAPTALH